MRRLACVFAVAIACTKPDATEAARVPAPVPAAPKPVLLTAGPRLLSNQTSQPVTVAGENLKPGLSLVLGAPVNQKFPLVVLDAKHAYARIPGELPVGDQAEVRVDVTLSEGTGSDHIVFANDTGFPDLTAFAQSADKGTLAAVSSTTDTVFLVDVKTSKVTPVHVGDGPSAIAAFALGQKQFFAVAHQFAPEVRLISLGEAPTQTTLAAPAYASAILVDKDVVYLAEQAHDTVSAWRLPATPEGPLAPLWTSPVLPNPRELEATPEGLWVGSLQTGALQLLELKTGKILQTVEPKPGTPIVGGGTEKFSKYVMNGKAPRDLAYSAKAKVLLESSIGPNIGPNPEKMEVSMNGGVAVVDARRGFVRHLGFGAGVTERLLIDDARGLVFASDVSLGVVRVIDLKKLVGADATAAKAVVQTIEIPAPEGFPHTRADGDFGHDNRATLSMHSGPRGLAVSADGNTLFVLNRYTGTIASVDVKGAAQGKAKFLSQFQVVDTLKQQTRRLGQVLYFADFGKTAMSCDACHLEGHSEGILYEKTNPLRVYRVPTVRGSRETPPYFTPASTFSMGETMKIVGGRNRFHNANPTPQEIEALTLFGSLVPTLPNPFVGADGAPATSLELPDGTHGDPRAGLALFEGKAECATCHPSPHFTMDQDLKTRNKFIDVGTPHFLPLREAMQDTRFEGFGTPALAGAWDTFPMLTSATAGLQVNADESVTVSERWPLRTAVEKWAPKHGRADLLSPQERNDLLAYVMSL